jgi:hypothetical protein
MGGPAGNYGALTVGSGKEVLDEERERQQRTNWVRTELVQGSVSLRLRAKVPVVRLNAQDNKLIGTL